MPPCTSSTSDHHHHVRGGLARKVFRSLSSTTTDTSFENSCYYGRCLESSCHVWSLHDVSIHNLTILHSFNKYAQVAARALRSSLKEEQRLAAEKRGTTSLRYQQWENGQGGPQVCFTSVTLLHFSQLSPGCSERGHEHYIDNQGNRDCVGLCVCHTLSEHFLPLLCCCPTRSVNKHFKLSLCLY